MKYEYVKILNVDFLFEGLKKSLLFRGNPIGNLHQLLKEILVLRVPQILLMMISLLIFILFFFHFDLTRWHKGVQSPHGPVSSCFNCFFGT